MPQTPGSGTLFPTALDNFTQPTPVNYMDLVSHAGEHDDINSAAMAIEAKLGIGNSSPTLAAVLVGTGTGSSGWTTSPTFNSLTVNNGITVLASGIQVTGNSAINGTIGVTGAVTLNNYAAHTVLVGEAASAVVGIAPGATAGVALISGGASADPSYGTVVVAGGGTGRTTLTTHSLLVGATLAAVTMLAVGTTGQVLIGATGADPAFAAPGTNSGLTAHGPLLGEGNGAFVAVTPSATSGVPFISQGSSADPVFGTAVVAGGGTGLATLTAYAVLCGGTTSTGNMQQVSGVGTSGQVLTSGGAGALPTWTTLSGGSLPDPVTVAHGGTGLTTLTTAYAVLCAGTTATGNVQPLAALGASGTVLTSNGAGALPSFQTATGLTNPMTTTGDIIYSSSGSTPARLAVGTGTNPLLTVSGGVPAWAALAALVQPCCRVYKSSAQSINSGAATVITFDSERYDTDTMHSTVSNTGRITFTTAGVYSVGASIEFAASALGNVRVVGIRLNGTTYISFEQQGPALGGTASTDLTTETEYKFAAADYVEVVAQQDSGGALNIASFPNASPEAWASFQSA